MPEAYPAGAARSNPVSVTMPFVRSLAQDQVPGALDIRGGKGLAVMPAHSAPQLKGELRHIVIPRPLRRQIGDDCIHSVLRHVLFENN